MEKTTSVMYQYANKTAIMSLLKKQPIEVIIESRELSKSQKIIFNVLWNLAKL